jgi:nucleotide-binding universal stress UspA family protein
MPVKHVVVHVDGAGRAEVRLDLALALCRRREARLTALFAEGASLGPAIVARRSTDQVLAVQKAVEEACAARAGAAGLPLACWALPPTDDVGRMAGAVAICCRYADLSIFGQHETEGARVPEDLVETVVLESGRPVLVVPARGRYAEIGKRVVIAWTGSRESARAVHDALPLLVEAERVTVLAFQQPSQGEAGPFPDLDIVAHLVAHGVPARYERVVVSSGDEDDVGLVDTLLNRGSDLTADLTVMGARAGRGFGTARLGGQARGLLRSMTTPVLLSA